MATSRSSCGSNAILAKRESKSLSDVGIVQALDRLLNQEGTVVLEKKEAILVERREQ